MATSRIDFDQLILDSEEGQDYLRDMVMDLMASTGQAVDADSVEDVVDIFSSNPEHFTQAAESKEQLRGGFMNLMGAEVSPLLLFALPIVWQVTKLILDKLLEKSIEQAVEVSLDTLKTWIISRKARACVIVTWPSHENQKRSLHIIKGEVFRVGTMDKENHLVLAGATGISALHLEIRIDKQGARIVDLNTQSTLLNGERCEGIKPLADRDEISFSGDGAPRLTFLENCKDSPLVLDAPRINQIQNRLDQLFVDYGVNEKDRQELQLLLIGPLS